MTDKAKHKRYIRIGGKLIGRQFSRKADADAWYAAKKREKELFESGIGVPTQTLTVREYAEQWMEARKAQGKPQSSWKTDEQRLRSHVFAEMGARPLQKITRREWEAYLNSLVTKKGMGPGTRNRVRALMSKMYNDALREEIVAHNPVRDVSKYKELGGAWDYWHTQDECRRYLVAAREEEPAFFIFAVLALNTGCRVGEILALRQDDVQLEKRRIHIWQTYEQVSHTICERTKGKTSRWLGMNDKLFAALVEYRRMSPFKRPGDLLVYRQDGEPGITVPMEEWMIRRRHYRVCRRAGIKEIRVHDLRHTYASHYVMSGGSLSDLQELLGHSSAEMTRKYAHLTPGHLESKSSVVAFSWQDESAEVVSLAQYSRASKSPGPDNQKSESETTDNPVTIREQKHAEKQ